MAQTGAAREGPLAAAPGWRLVRGIEPTFLGKLFDDAPRDPGSGMSKRLSLEEFKACVAEDLESLLNSRAVVDETLLKDFPECRRSLITYGLKDLAGKSLSSFHDRTFICRSLELAIERHEPRLRDAHVEIHPDSQSIRALHFSIKALLIVHPAMEPVSFDALLQPATLKYSVARPRRAAAA